MANDASFWHHFGHTKLYIAPSREVKSDFKVKPSNKAIWKNANQKSEAPEGALLNAEELFKSILAINTC